MKYISLAILSTLFLSACAITDDNKEPEKIDPREGETVNQICFAGRMDGWSPLEGDNKALIVYDRRNEAYKLTLVGTCDPQWAMMRIATVSRGSSSCLSRGDKVITDADMDRYDNCTIMRINKWHPEKLEVEEKLNQKQGEKEDKENKDDSTKIE